MKPQPKIISIYHYKRDPITGKLEHTGKLEGIKEADLAKRFPGVDEKLLGIYRHTGRVEVIDAPIVRSHAVGRVTFVPVIGRAV